MLGLLGRKGNGGRASSSITGKTMAAESIDGAWLRALLSGLTGVLVGGCFEEPAWGPTHKSSSWRDKLFFYGI